MGPYLILKETFARLFSLEQESARLTWRQVSGQPARGRRPRPAAVIGGEISGLLRGAGTAEAMRRCLDRIEKLSAEQQANVRFWRSRWWRVSRLPAGLVEALSAAGEECRTAWNEARQVDDFAVVLPTFRQVVALTREKADLWKEPGMTRYDAMLDLYDPGQRAAALAERHGWLEDAEWEENRDDHESEEIDFFKRDAWRQPVEAVADACGFDLRRGRIDLGAHSMTLTAGANDIRLLLCDRPGRSALVQLLHEIGHGKLEQELKRHPLWSWRAHAPSQAHHERAAQAHEETGCSVIGERLDNGYHFGGRFEDAFRVFAEKPAGNVCSPIRLESTGAWPAWHIWVRFKIERELIEKDCQPDKLPELWNQMMHTRMDIAPRSLREGCLQDIQWFTGLFGYFPIYWQGGDQSRVSVLDAAHPGKANFCFHVEFTH